MINSPYLCLDCAKLYYPKAELKRCTHCKSPRLRTHPEIETLHIAHIDCDSFYASVEKLDFPEFASKPLIVGNRERGVAAACCYIARAYGIKSAMPMFQILNLCPNVVIRPARMDRYIDVGLRIRNIFLDTTPAIEPLSIDEAFLDLSGLEILTGKKPCEILAGLINRIKLETGIQVSAGLAPNKFLAKTASDIEKPKGFFIIGKTEAQSFLSNREIGSMYGVGKSLTTKLNAIGVEKIGDLLRYDMDDLIKKFGIVGANLHNFARGIDNRIVKHQVKQKSIGKEHSYTTNIKTLKELDSCLYKTCVEVTDVLKDKNIIAGTITLKLRDDNGNSITRSKSLSTPSNLCNIFYKTLSPILTKAIDRKSTYRLLGISASNLDSFDGIDVIDLGNPDHLKDAKRERTIDKINQKFGKNIVRIGKYEK